MSLNELASIDVSSVSKTTQALSDAPAAIYVITHQDIVRSGATTLPELLRLAPNLQVAQTSASGYVITARGLSGNLAAQNFTNKLLVMIDGRSVYTPLYSGVYWDMQDVVPADIERIEVISGPGATLWGANAVNGVINITTRRASETQGGFAEVEAGGRERSASLRYGGRLGESLTFRAYARGFAADETRTASGGRANDDWWRLQGGFRADWAPTVADLFTVQGDAYHGSIDQLDASDGATDGRNLLARWTRRNDDGSGIQVQGYYDRTERSTGIAGARYALDTFDLYAQHSLSPMAGHNLVWGAGVRASHYHIVGSENLLFEPARRTLWLTNLFAQDSIDLDRRTQLIVGLKLEDDPYAGLSLLPNLRLSWKPTEEVLLWGAVSRAVRSPTPFDRDVVEKFGGGTALVGGENFRTEKLTAFEAGTRIQAGSGSSLSLSFYYNLYDDLRSVEVTPQVMLPLHWGNMLHGHSYGLDAWGHHALTSWWRLSAGFNLLRQDFTFKPGSSGLLGVEQLGSDPRHQAMLRSSMNLGSRLNLDLDLRYVGPRRAPHVPSYVELGGRLGWALTDHLQASISGLNLLHKWHQEFTVPGSNQVPRKILAGLQWRF